jgi:hypothetical protein
MESVIVLESLEYKTVIALFRIDLDPVLDIR